MDEEKVIRKSKKDLPLLLELQGDNGAVEWYEIKPAVKKLGAIMVKTSDSLRQLLLRQKHSNN